MLDQYRREAWAVRSADMKAQAEGVPKEHVERAFEGLEEQKRDPLLPSLISEEQDREDDREM